MEESLESAQRRFREVFSDFDLVAGFARRRGSRDPEAIAAETMSIAWRRLDELDSGSCRPWLLATARNLLLAEYRDSRVTPEDPVALLDIEIEIPDFDVETLDTEIDRALKALEPKYREALLLIAWEELTPQEAAASLGIRPSAFRVRLHRARNRFAELIDKPGRASSPSANLRKEGT